MNKKLSVCENIPERAQTKVMSVVGDGGGGLSSIWNVFTDVTLFVYDYMWSLAFRPNESNSQ